MQLAFFSEDDSNTSDEEVDSDDGQDSDQEYDNTFDVEQLERRSTGKYAVLFFCCISVLYLKGYKLTVRLFDIAS